MIDRIVPRLYEQEAISYAHRNLLPHLQISVRRTEVRTRIELEDMTIAAEKTYRVVKTYRPPSTP